jgi:hypothetical protein
VTVILRPRPVAVWHRAASDRRRRRRAAALPGRAGGGPGALGRGWHRHGDCQAQAATAAAGRAAVHIAAYHHDYRAVTVTAATGCNDSELARPGRRRGHSQPSLRNQNLKSFLGNNLSISTVIRHAKSNMSSHFVTGILAGFTVLASLFMLCQFCYKMGYNDARQNLMKNQNTALNEVDIVHTCCCRMHNLIPCTLRAGDPAFP